MCACLCLVCGLDEKLEEHWQYLFRQFSTFCTCFNIFLITITPDNYVVFMFNGEKAAIHQQKTNLLTCIVFLLFRQLLYQLMHNKITYRHIYSCSNVVVFFISKPYVIVSSVLIEWNPWCVWSFNAKKTLVSGF